MGKYIETIRRHPKITSTIIFTLLVGILSFSWGYRQDNHRRDKDGKPFSVEHHFLNGMKWVGIIYTLLLLLGVIIGLIFKLSFWEMYFFGGDLINGIFQIMIAMLEILSKN